MELAKCEMYMLCLIDRESGVNGNNNLFLFLFFKQISFSSTVFQQTLISAGTEPALKLILNTLKDESLPTSEGTVQRLFAQLPMTIKTPTLMPQILVRTFELVQRSKAVRAELRLTC